MNIQFFRKFVSVLTLLVFTIFFSQVIFSIEDTLTITSPNYFSEQNNIYTDIHYLENEFLSFNFCLNSESIDKKIKITCDNGDYVELPIYDYKTPDCFFSNFDLENTVCNDFNLEISYNSENKIGRAHV